MNILRITLVTLSLEVAENTFKDTRMETQILEILQNLTVVSNDFRYYSSKVYLIKLEFGIQHFVFLFMAIFSVKNSGLIPCEKVY